MHVEGCHKKLENSISVTKTIILFILIMQLFFLLFAIVIAAFNLNAERNSRGKKDKRKE